MSLTAALAPKPSPHARRVGPYIVAGCLSSNTGLGQSARLCHDALAACGVDVRGIDLTEALFQRSDNTDFRWRDARDFSGPATLIVHVNAPLMPLALTALGRKTVADKWIIGYWAWELEKAPPDWHVGGRFVHEVWTPSHFSAQAISGFLSHGAPLRVVPHPVTLSLQAGGDVSGLPEGKRFTVLSILDASSSLARKNPTGVVAAFKAAFGNDPGANLVLKISNLDRAGSHADALRDALRDAPNITLIDRPLPLTDMASLFSRADVLLSLHRSEGFGLTLAEAMLHSRPVVGVRWSGEADFFDGTVGIPVQHRLIPALDPQGTYNYPTLVWADADISDTAAALRKLRENPARCIALGVAARTRALHLWTAENYVSAAQIAPDAVNPRVALSDPP